MADVLCPKCVTPMRAIERNGVTIERCPECGGIFLDRGELERLTQAETAYSAAPPVERERDRYPDRDDDHDDDDRRRYASDAPRYDEHGRPVRKKKRRGFLEDLFDFGGDD